MMNLIELFAALACLGIYSAGMSGNFLGVYKTFSKTMEIRKELSRDYFIAEGFKSICKNKNQHLTAKTKEEELRKFELICNSLWQLDELSFEIADSFNLQKGNSNYLEKKHSGRLFKAVWRTENKICTVLCSEEN